MLWLGVPRLQFIVFRRDHRRTESRNHEKGMLRLFHIDNRHRSISTHS